MIMILLAEAKTMGPCEGDVTPARFSAHKPAGYSRACSLMAGWAQLTTAALASAIKISAPLALSAQSKIIGFANQAYGENAIDAFTGVVFRALDAQSLDSGERERLNRWVKIVSSLYGFLNADDIVKPYRLDYGARLAPGGLTMARYQKPYVTDCLIDAIKRHNITDIIDLMPADAAACVDWQRIAPHSQRWTVEFRQLTDNGLRTPGSAQLKKLRGELTRQIVTDSLDSIAAIVAATGADSPWPGVLRYVV